MPKPPHRLRIAIDGPAGAGKSTVARMVAERLGYLYVDTGALYRAVALAALQAGVPPADREAVACLAERLDLTIRPGRPGQGVRVYLNGRDVTDSLRTPAVTEHVPLVAGHPEVRERLLGVMRALAAEGGVVMDGRDIGTVVLPDAEVKVFLTASLDERARRRWAELRRQGYEVDVDEVKATIQARDRQDAGRRVAPLRPADGAVIVDTSGRSVAEVVEEILSLCSQVSAQARGLAGMEPGVARPAGGVD